MLLRKPGYDVIAQEESVVQQEFMKQRESFDRTKLLLKRALLQRSDPEKRLFAKRALESVIPVDLGPQELQMVIFAQKRSLAAFDRRTTKLKKDLARQTFELNRLKKRLSKITNPFEDDADGAVEGEDDNLDVASYQELPSSC